MSDLKNRKLGKINPIRNSDTKKKRGRQQSNIIRSVRLAKGLKLIDFIEPMKASIGDKAFNSADWLFEIKWDGYRAVAEIAKDIKFYSRNGLSFSTLYPQVAEELKKIKEEVILDGEIIVLNKNSKPDFQKLQQYDHHRSLQLIYYIFDCLSYRGKSTLNLPLIERKKIAQKVIPQSNIIKYSDHILEDGIAFFTKVVEIDIEGIVAKRINSLYTPGKRSNDWLKIKNHNTQEAIIAGYTAPRGGRKYFGALILGIMSQGKLKYIGHTGTGFTQTLLKEIYEQLQPLKRSTSPFEKKVTVNTPVTWVEPVLVCNIKFTEVTADEILRHPVFMGLRIDKSAQETTTIDALTKK
jgi:bifunctional non-homologous end joining protein LigD